MNTIYKVTKTKNGRQSQDELLPFEFNLIKTMINDGYQITGIEKLKVRKEYIETHFVK